MQTVQVMKERWDYLIVLDACRFDYFNEVYKEYIDGELESRSSVGTGTSEWRDKSFTEYYDDVIYISANPYINSIKKVRDFIASDYFHKVYDLWLDCWDDESGTVLPETVSEKAIEIIKANPAKRAIIHYVQPHEPYLTDEVDTVGFRTPQAGGYLQGLKTQVNPKITDKLMRILSGVFYWSGIRGNKLIWPMRQMAGLPPAGPMDAVRRKYGREKLRKAYKENVRVVLKHLPALIDELGGRIIITADHGEMLGEDGYYCHWSRAKRRELREVPWLVIEKDKGARVAGERQLESQPEEEPPDSKDRQEEIRNKLRALGYYD